MSGAAPAAAPAGGTSEVSLLSERMQRFGVLGAGAVFDPMSTVKLAQVRGEEPAASASPPQTSMPEPAGAPTAVVPASSTAATSAPGPGGKLTRQQILEVLAETVRVQAIVQQEISQLARKLAKELRSSSKEKDREKGERKKRKTVSFVEGHKKILELNLPQEPLENYGLTESSFQRLLLQYEEDEEVMASAQKLLHPVGKGDPERARGITMEKIIEIHQFMVAEMQRVLQEFLQLPQDARRSYTSKGCETTAELLVSIAVEQQLGVHCEDVEQAVIAYEELLQDSPEFSQCTDQLAGMMQHLIGAAQPRVEKEEFLQMLRHMGESTRKARAFAKKLYEDYRAKTCSITEAYRRFEEFAGQQQGEEGEEVPDLSTVEMQLCYDEYREDPEVRTAWEQAGVDSNPLMQAMMASTVRSSSSSSPPAEEKKGKKLKASEIAEMQELMVDEMKRAVDAAAQVLGESGGAGGKPAWKAEVAVQMIQALASGAVERRYGVSAEEMTVAGFQNAQLLQKNERFVRSTEKQQELLIRVAQLCGQE